MRQEDRSLELADKTCLIMKNYKEVLSMKDKIKNALVKVLWAINLPFFLVRLLLAGIPISVGLCIAFDYTEKDAFIHLSCCMLEAVWISGPIALLLDYCRYKWFGVDFKYDINDLEERTKKMFNK